MPQFLKISLAAASAAWALAAVDAGCGAGEEGQCAQRPRVGRDHVMLQVANGRLSQAANLTGPQDVGTDGCNGMPDIKKSCSDNKCFVLADDMVGLSCNDYCGRSGRKCVAAWEEVDGDCNKKLQLTCDQSYGTTSDLLCQCSDYLAVDDNRRLVATTLVWSDEFNGESVDQSKWGFVTGGGGFGNSELEYYTPHAAVVKDGTLRITAKCENYGGERFTSAKLTTKDSGTWGPGHRVEVRARSPIAKGTWPAIWMLPEANTYGNWPMSGEIDIMESVGCAPGKVFGTVHTNAYNHMHSTQSYGTRQLTVSDWHTYALQWTDSGVQWFVDDVLFGVFRPTHHNSDRWPFNQKFYLILNLAVGGSWGGMCLPKEGPSCDAGSDFSNGQVLEVDYARVYKL